LSGSDAPIAMDLRRTVYRLLTDEGLTDDEIRNYLQERYGDFVLYDPPFKPSTWVLWLAPVGFVFISAFVLLRVLRQSPAEPLSESEAERLRVILDDN
ncbi:MAG: cytochrome c-type biogenesis protein CcmH, partial [Gammaproteobacteria bacterium]|nr:cytochrome c-type biogenesis protein CcmH [Gammaproteobacteria bacterium]